VVINDVEDEDDDREYTDRKDGDSRGEQSFEEEDEEENDTAVGVPEEDEDELEDESKEDEEQAEDTTVRTFFVLPGEGRLILNVSKHRAVVERKTTRCAYCRACNIECKVTAVKEACRKCAKLRIQCESETANFIILDKDGNRTDADADDRLVPLQHSRHNTPTHLHDDQNQLSSLVHSSLL